MTQTKQESDTAWDAAAARSEFIKWLIGVPQSDYQGNPRAILADLRSGLRDRPADLYRMGKYIVPYLDNKPSPQDRWFYLVGALFAEHPVHDARKEYRNFGASLRALRTSDRGSDSLDKRFLGLLNSHPDEVGRHLRQLTGQLKSQGIPVNWFQLLGDLCYWDHPNHDVQRGWARDYYKADTQIAEADSTDTAGEEPQTEGDIHED